MMYKMMDKKISFGLDVLLCILECKKAKKYNKRCGSTI